MQGRYEEALGDFSEVLQVAPQYGKCRMRRGDVYRSMEKYDLALQGK